MKYNIRFKILIGFAILMTLSLLVQGVSFVITRQYITSQITQLQQEQVEKGAYEVEEFFNDMNTAAQRLANVYENDPASIDASTKYVLSNNDEIKRVTYLSPAGKELRKFDTTGKIADDKLTFEVLSEPFFSAVTGTSSISKVYYIDDKLGPYLNLYAPIVTKQSSTSAVIKMQINASQLQNNVRDITLNRSGYIYIVDNEGRLLAHPVESYLMERPNLSSRDIIADYQQNRGAKAEYQYVNERNETVLAHAQKVSGYDWVVVFEQPISEAYVFLDLIRNIFISALFGSMGVLLLISLQLSENLTRSIRKLDQSAKEVKKGQFKKISVIRSGDEMESLSISFSDLVDQLQEREHSLQNITIQLEKANKKLKQLDILKNEFVSVASHELRTPMTAIKSYLWMALEGKGGELNEKQKYYIQRGYNSVDRLVRLVNDMLNISRIESGTIKLTMISLDLKKIAEDVIEEVQPKANELGVIVTMNEIAQLPTVMADHDKIKEILFNLIGNSLKFTPKGGTVKISFAVNEDFVETSIKDTGSGIEADDISKLFQKFGLMPGSYTTNQTAMGTGLGLYICRSIIEQHGGRIWAQSEGRGKGATFTFKLKIFTNEDLEKYNQSVDTSDKKDVNSELLHNEV